MLGFGYFPGVGCQPENGVDGDSAQHSEFEIFHIVYRLAFDWAESANNASLSSVSVSQTPLALRMMGLVWHQRMVGTLVRST